MILHWVRTADVLALGIALWLLPGAGRASDPAAADTVAAPGTLAAPRLHPSGIAVFKFGAYIPDNGITSSDGTAYAQGLGLGVGFHPLLGLELGIGWHAVDVPVTFVTSTTELPLPIYTVTLSEVIQHRWRMGGSTATVYGLVGPGLFLDFEEEETHTAVGIQAGVGAHLWLFGLEARYHSATLDLGGRDLPLDGWILSVNGGVH
jgi:hypothetical protein